MGRYGRSRKGMSITKDYDSSHPDVQKTFNKANEERKGFVSRVKESIRKYNSPEAKEERRIKKLERREQELKDLKYHAKKEKLKSMIRKSKSSNRSPIFGTSNSYRGMDEMLGINSNRSVSRKETLKPKKSSWANMDKMLGNG